MKTKISLLAFCLAMIVSSQMQAQFSVFASGFNHPIGISYDPNDNIWVAEAGTGANDSKISMIDLSAVVYPVITGLPSFLDTLSGEVTGAWRAEWQVNHLMVVVGPGPDTNAGTIMYFDISGFTPGVTAPMTPADADSILYVSDWVLSHGFMDSNPYSVCLDGNNNLYIADAGANALIKYTPSTQTFSVLDTFPAIPNPWGPNPPAFDYVPTRIINGATAPGGSPGFYMGNLGGFGPGFGRVVLIDSGGVVTQVDSNYTSVVDIQYDFVGLDRYILQFGEFDSLFNPVMGSSKIFRVDNSGNSSMTCSGFGPSAGFTRDRFGGAYATEIFAGNVIYISDITGIQNPAKSDITALKAFPNPFRSSVDISVDLGINTDASLEIKNMAGELLYTKSVQLSKGENKFVWDGKSISGNDVPAGHYIISVISPKASTTARIVKQ